MKLYDKRLIDKKARSWISYEISNGQEYFTIYNNIFSMIWNMIWKRKKLISMSIIDKVITTDTDLLNSMIYNINITYLETCLNESEV